MRQCTKQRAARPARPSTRTRATALRRRVARCVGAWACALGMVLLPAIPAAAGSCGALRSFAGVITSASGSAIAVERGGRSTSFQKAAGVRVVDEAGAGVSGWSGLRAGLRVQVCWAFEDEPRAARTVFVTGR